MKAIIFSLFVVVYSDINAQVLGINMGTHLIPEQVLFDNPLSNSPRPFVFVGLSYQTQEVTMGINYTVDLHIVTFTTNIPLLNFNKKRYNSYALLNHRKTFN